jgi:hypothetical protein
MDGRCGATLGASWSSGSSHGCSGNVVYSCAGNTTPAISSAWSNWPASRYCSNDFEIGSNAPAPQISIVSLGLSFNQRHRSTHRPTQPSNACASRSHWSLIFECMMVHAILSACLSQSRQGVFCGMYSAWALRCRTFLSLLWVSAGSTFGTEVIASQSPISLVSTGFSLRIRSVLRRS